MSPAKWLRKRAIEDLQKSETDFSKLLLNVDRSAVLQKNLDRVMSLFKVFDLVPIRYEIFKNFIRSRFLLEYLKDPFLCSMSFRRPFHSLIAHCCGITDLRCKFMKAKRTVKLLYILFLH